MSVSVPPILCGTQIEKGFNIFYVLVIQTDDIILVLVDSHALCLFYMNY
jgi:hypothetical protein